MPYGRLTDDAATMQRIRKSVQILPHSPSKSSPIELASLIAANIPHHARFVLLGEASHGTDEFYRTRSRVTEILIEERGFDAVVVEADFPDAFRANLYVRGMSGGDVNGDQTAEDALGDFIRFPQWMWRNTAVRDFLEWLKAHNAKGGARNVGFYGMDVYSLHTSAAKVIAFLDNVDPEAANKVRERYACFDRFGDDSMAYAYAVGMAKAPACTDEAVQALTDVIAKRAQHAVAADGEVGRELQFAAECNAWVVAGAENYYRQMFFGDELTWNIRDTHFANTIGRIDDHLERRRRRAGQEDPAKIVIWAHNSHLGDASVTDMGQRRGELNLGQLMRERYERGEVFNVGFTTHSGSVAAADEWDAPGQRKVVRPSLPGSYENVFHALGIPSFVLNFRNIETKKHEEDDLVKQALAGPMLERAIGVIYRPRSERQSHYFYADITQQFDLIAHIDETTAVTPLDPGHPSWEQEHLAKEDIPETFPFAI